MSKQIYDIYDVLAPNRPALAPDMEIVQHNGKRYQLQSSWSEIEQRSYYDIADETGAVIEDAHGHTPMDAWIMWAWLVGEAS